MKLKHIGVRMDSVTGQLWLTEEKYMQPPKRIANIDQHVMMSLCADLFHENGTKEISRDIIFADGAKARVIIRDVTDGDPEEEKGSIYVS